MAAELVEVEILVMVDSEGQWEIGTDGDDLAQRWSDTVGDDVTADARRVVKIKVKVPKPTVVEIVGEVPAENGTVGELKVV